MNSFPTEHLPSHLAINGGQPVRSGPFPYRALFGEQELQAVQRVFENANKKQQDFGFQSHEEEAYCKEFSEYVGGGYCDAVSSGSAGIFLALKALKLKAGDEILMSPVNDPGAFSAVVLAGLKPILIDSAESSYNINATQFEKALTSTTKAALIAHIGGLPTEDIEQIALLANKHEIHLIEDCSQSHGAEIKEVKVGNFGDIAVFSTMFSKTHASGGCGGIVFTKSEELYWRIRQNADRGKSFQDPNYNPKDPLTFSGPALNFNQDELSCAIGRSTLRKLNSTIERRLSIVRQIDEAIAGQKAFITRPYPDRYKASPFFHTIGLNLSAIKVPKHVFCAALSAEGITCNPNYNYIIAEWPWAKEYLPANSTTPNATTFKENSFNLTFTEALADNDIADIIAILHKVDEALTH